MDCRHALPLLSDHLEGGLHPIARAELEAHLTSCANCRALREAIAEVVEELRAFPVLEPPAGLAERAAAAALASGTSLPRVVIVRPAIPSWVQAAAAGFALIALGAGLLLVGPEAPSRTATRLVVHTVSAGTYLIERRDRLVEEVRVLGLSVGTAVESGLDGLEDRVQDYRRLLDRQRGGDEDRDGRRGGTPRVAPDRLAAAFRTDPASSS